MNTSKKYQLGSRNEQKNKVVKPLVLAVWVAMSGSSLAQSQMHPKANDKNTLDAVNVVATREEKPNIETPATVTTITQEDIERKGARSIKELFAEELDVDVRQNFRRGNSVAASKGSNESINIRGLEGNRLNLMVDGIRLPYSFSFGPNSAARGDYLDVDGVQSVEVIRGASSAQYGSDGVAGTVLFRTLTPEHVLKDKQQVTSVHASYFDVNTSTKGVLTHARKGDDWSAVFVGSLSRGGELKNQGTLEGTGTTRTKNNPSDNDDRYLMGKLRKKVDGANSLLLNVENSQKKIETNNLNAIGRVSGFGPPFDIYQDLGRDQIDRSRVSVDHIHRSAQVMFDQVESKVWYQQAKINQFTFQDRSTTDRTRDNKVENDAYGAQIRLSKKFTSRDVAHLLQYGLDVSESQTSQITVRTGDQSTPEQYIPKTKQQFVGAFVQNDIQIGHLNVVPALRFDRWDISSRVVNKSDQAASPSLALMWLQNPQIMPFLNVGRGFRAPSVEELAASFDGLGYNVVPNINLNPERSLAKELGVKGSVRRLKYSLAYFDNDYKNFISSGQPVNESVCAAAGLPLTPPLPGGRPEVCQQSLNQPKANIHGIDIRAEYRFNEHWQVKGGYVKSKGRETTRQGVSQPINTIQPERLIIAADYSQANWGASASVRHVWGKSKADIAGLTPTTFAPGSYTTVNTRLRYMPTKQLSFFAGINNLFDEKYIDWANISSAGLTNATATDFYTSAGRNFFVSMKYEF
jgi:hemoglobin/transferrin/lactoferrin receptor protein